MGRYSGKTCRLSVMLGMTASFFLVEIIVGYVTNSLALVADSFHMLSDVVALVVGFASVKISKWPSKRNTYGWVRAEILGALVNAVFLLALCFSILVQSLKRLVEVEKVDNPVLLLVVGAIGLVVNVIGLFLFAGHGHSHGGGGHGHSHGGGGHGHSHGGGGHGHSHKKESSTRKEDLELDHQKTLTNGQMADTVECDQLVSAVDESIKTTTDGDIEIYMGPSPDIAIEFKKPDSSQSQLNMRGVFLHVLGDALGSVVVIVSALVIMLADGNWKYYVDPGMSVLMVCIILSSTIPLFKETAFILLQTVPSHVNVEHIISELEQMEGIYGVHECHIWQLAGNRIVASAHIRCHGIEEYMSLAAKIKTLFHKEGIHSTTIQPEFIDYTKQPTDLSDCALLCMTDGDQKCQPDTCCGDRVNWLSRRLNTNDRGNNGVTAENLNSNKASVLPQGGESSGAGRFTSSRSLDLKFSPDGDEVVFEMNLVAGEGEGVPVPQSLANTSSPAPSSPPDEVDSTKQPLMGSQHAHSGTKDRQEQDS